MEITDDNYVQGWQAISISTGALNEKDVILILSPHTLPLNKASNPAGLAPFANCLSDV